MTAFPWWLLFVLVEAPPPAEGPMSLRVLTYNIHHAEGSDGKLDLERIAAIIHRTDADVVCLQEVDKGLPRTQGLDFPKIFEEKLLLKGLYGVNYRFDGGEYGNATFSRHPIVAHENFPLPNPNNAEPRGCLRTTLRIEGVEVDVLNTHLGLKPNERASQAEKLLEIVRDQPTILVGDFNEGPNAPGVSMLRTVFDQICPDSVIQSFEESRPRNQIDFLFGAHGAIVKNCRVLDDPMVQVASDHRPVVAEFNFSASQQSEEKAQGEEVGP